MDTKLSRNDPFIKRLRRLNRRRDRVGRRRPTQIRDEERADILTLHGAGYTFARIADTLDRSEVAIARVVQGHHAEMRETHASTLLDNYMRASSVAAENGDHRPALELLDRLGVIPETSKQRTALSVAHMTSEAQRAMVANGAKALAQASSPTVNIGIGFPAQLAGVSQVPERGIMQVSLASENQQLTAIGDEGLEIPSSQPVVRAVRDAG